MKRTERAFFPFSVLLRVSNCIYGWHARQKELLFPLSAFSQTACNVECKRGQKGKGKYRNNSKDLSQFQFLLLNSSFVYWTHTHNNYSNSDNPTPFVKRSEQCNSYSSLGSAVIPARSHLHSWQQQQTNRKRNARDVQSLHPSPSTHLLSATATVQYVLQLTGLFVLCFCPVRCRTYCTVLWLLHPFKFQRFLCGIFFPSELGRKRWTNELYRGCKDN